MKKKCSSCGKTKETVDFSKQSGGKQGVKGECKMCQSERYRLWICKKRIDDTYMEYRRKYKRKYQRSHIKERNAHNAVNRKISKGEIQRPEMCDCCGQKKFVHAHHENYCNIFDVRWLCAICHKKVHSRRNVTFLKKHA